jgi:hypothetical protein
VQIHHLNSQSVVHQCVSSKFPIVMRGVYGGHDRAP